MKRVLYVLAVFGMSWVSMGASCGGAKHVATVSVVTTKEVLKAVQSTEQTLVCGRTSAPPAGQCVTIEKHHQIEALIEKAAHLDGQVATLVRDTPSGAPQPSQITAMLGDIAGIVTTVLEMIPASPKKDTLVADLKGVK